MAVVVHGIGRRHGIPVLHGVAPLLLWILLLLLLLVVLLLHRSHPVAAGSIPRGLALRSRGTRRRTDIPMASTAVFILVVDIAVGADPRRREGRRSLGRSAVTVGRGHCMHIFSGTE